MCNDFMYISSAKHPTKELFWRWGEKGGGDAARTNRMCVLLLCINREEDSRVFYMGRERARVRARARIRPSALVDGDSDGKQRRQEVVGWFSVWNKSPEAPGGGGEGRENCTCENFIISIFQPPSPSKHRERKGTQADIRNIDFNHLHR